VCRRFIRDVLILLAEFLEKCNIKHKEQNAGKMDEILVK